MILKLKSPVPSSSPELSPYIQFPTRNLHWSMKFPFRLLISKIKLLMSTTTPPPPHTLLSHCSPPLYLDHHCTRNGTRNLSIILFMPFFLTSNPSASPLVSVFKTYVLSPIAFHYLHAQLSVQDTSIYSLDFCNRLPTGLSSSTLPAYNPFSIQHPMAI